jgi:type IV pilus assembly protein PilY1
LAVRTYTIDVGTPDAAHTGLLKNMANQSDGHYYTANAASSSDIAGQINQALTEIQAVNSVFASVSLPVNVSTQGTYRNQVFIGMFRPDANAYPRWFGNLKQYKLGYDTSLNDNVLRLLYDNADSSPTASLSAINTTTGFITGCARSFWTPVTVDTYWTSFPEQNCLSVANSAPSNFPDGYVVEKGAQGYKLRGSTTRTVKTCSSAFASCTSLVDFNNTNVSQADLGPGTTTTERDNLINWAKGLDVQDEDLDLTTTTEMRLSAHGDVVHSRPVAINFGTDASPQVVVFYGANDGALRAINGNRSATIGSVAAGGELWSFMPPEFFTKIKRIYANTTQISFPGSTATPAPLPKPYGVDGPIVAIKGTTDTWLYATMRRGGRAMYAFNVPNATPASPTLKWKRGCSNNFKDVRTGAAVDRGTIDDLAADVCSTGGAGDWSGIGQTWAPPAVVRAAGYTGGSPAAPKPLLVMGGGYDTCQDADPNSGCSSSSKGTNIYVIDADTGNLLNTFPTDSSVVAEVTVVPDDQGLAKYIYAADLGGNVYRISGADANSEIGSTAPGSWTKTKIAVLGGTGTDNRKFMFKPDVVVNSAGGYSILLGSGDREKPLLSYTAAASVTNYFFMLRDKPTVATWLSDESATCGGNYLCLGSLLGIAWDGANPTSAALSAMKGWYLGLRPNEQVVTSAITVFDTVTFSSHRPYGSTPAETEPDYQNNPACGSNLGTAKVYNVNYSDASAPQGETRSHVIHGGGLPPSPVAGMVRLDNGQEVPFIIGGSPTSAIEGGSPPAPFTAARPKRRTYWYIQK